MQERIITGLVLVVAVIHILPIAGVLGGERLAALYGVDITDSNLEILMRHRAVLFAILGAFFAYAAFRHDLQPLAFGAAAVSLGSFLALATMVGGLNGPLRKVVVADLVAAACLAAAVALYPRQEEQLRQHRRRC